MVEQVKQGEIDPQTLQMRLNNGEQLTLVHTLPRDHYLHAHIPSAQCACVFEVTFLQQIADITSDKEREIILYGWHSGSMDAVVAAAKLARAGYRNVIVLDGGLVKWKDAGCPLEGDDLEGIFRAGKEPILEDRTYRVDTDLSVIEWTGRNPNVKHYGTLKLSRGEMRVNNGNASGTFDIDMKSIKNTNLEGDALQPVLIAHLMSDDFFFVSRFPTARFNMEGAKPMDHGTLTTPNFVIQGALELCSVSQELYFPTIITRRPDGEIAAEAHLDIDRTRWNIIYGSNRFFQHLGMHLVFDLLSIELRIVAR